MSAAFGNDLDLAGRCYHDLFRGEDTDEAESAARHLAKGIEALTQVLTRKSE